MKKKIFMLNDILKEFHGIFIGILYDYDVDKPILRIAINKNWIKINNADFSFESVGILDDGNINIYDIIILNDEKTIDDAIKLLRMIVDNNRQIEKMQEEHFNRMEEFKNKILQTSTQTININKDLQISNNNYLIVDEPIKYTVKSYDNDTFDNDTFDNFDGRDPDE